MQKFARLLLALGLFTGLVAVMAESFQFDAEVPKMRDIIIKHLYKDEEIFLRELVSNSADAIEKLRQHILKTKPDGQGSEYKLFNISISPNPQAGTLTIEDNGVGMTFQELKKNLGTIGTSGSAEYIKNIKDGKSASDIIGQFGVGFYSAFLVADVVEVISKHEKDDQYRWRSEQANDFTIEKDDLKDGKLEHGTKIILHLKKDKKSAYTNQDTLRKILTHHSQFVSYPIYLNVTKTFEIDDPDAPDEYEEPEKDAEEAADEESTESADKDSTEAADKDHKESKETKKPKLKPKPKIKKTTSEWQHVNEERPIWVRDAKSVNQTEYNKFYTKVFKDSSDPMRHVLFSGEGDVNFKSLVYIPRRAGYNVLQAEKQSYAKNIRVYVRRVLITDELVDYLPRFCAFVKGLIDGEDFPINVSRETIKNDKSLRKIKDVMINKIIETFEDIAKNETEYKDFYKEYATNLKLGSIESDGKRKMKLNKLIRFHSSVDNKTGVPSHSFDDYVKRMRKGQKSIYYIVDSTLNGARTSPHAERLVSRGYELAIFTDVYVDEHFLQGIRKYGKFSLQNVAKGSIDFGDESEEEKEDIKSLEEKFKPLTERLTKELSEHVEKTVISKRLTKTSCALVAPEYGWTGRMRTIMKNQRDHGLSGYYMGLKSIFEINPNHPVILSMLAKVETETFDEDVVDLAKSLLDMALLTSGYPIDDVTQISRRIENAVRMGLGVDLKSQAKYTVKPAPEIDPEVKIPTEDASDDDSHVSSIPDDDSGNSDDESYDSSNDSPHDSPNDSSNDSPNDSPNDSSNDSSNDSEREEL